MNDSVMTINEAIAQAKAHEQANRPNDALKMYSHILKSKPNYVEALHLRARLFQTHNNHPAALKDYTTLLPISPQPYLTHCGLADVYSALKQFDNAIKHYKLAIASNNEYTAPYMPFVSLLERMQQLDDAHDIVKQGIANHPNLADMHFLQGKLFAKQKEFQKAEASYQKAVDLGLPSRAQHIVLGEFANVKEKLKKYDEAMELCILAQKYASQTQTALATNSDISDKIIQGSRGWFTGDNIAGWDKEAFATDKKAPIFLAGFPRSGTTLMEQILLAHPNLTVTDELQVIPAKVHFLDKVIGREVPFPEGLKTLKNNEIQHWRDEYYSAMGRLMPDTAPSLRLVDKNPTSFYYFGVIQRFFPESPAIMMIRDPRDVCLSCFFQTFAPNTDTVHFYSLEDTAKFYAEIMSLYLEFRDTLPLNLLQIKYEDLCDDFETNARAVFNHIGEEWHDDILRYHELEKRQFIQTPSYEAVRKPVNKNAIAKWKNYEQYFEPITPILQPFLDEFGYK